MQQIQCQKDLGGGGGGANFHTMQKLSVRVRWLCHADATFFYFCERWNILLKLPAISWLLKWSFLVWHKLLRLRHFSFDQCQCLSRVECSLQENGLCQSTNPFSATA